MAKIAVELEQALAARRVAGASGETRPRVLAQGEGWTVADVLCTAGPQDRPFEEQHSSYTIAMVTAGSFQYRGHAGCELMSPGSLVLGNAGQYFECGHDHAAGDRCLAFWYRPEYFERLTTDAGARKLNFPALRMPPLRELAPLAARALAAFSRTLPEPEEMQLAKNGEHRPEEVSAEANGTWEEISIELAARVVRLAGRLSPAENAATPSAIARVTRAVRMIECRLGDKLSLATLARNAGLSPYHFLRIFEQLTGLTPHQYVLRARLRQAAARLASGPDKVLNIAFDCGFGDVSNFNHAFRAEFGASPRELRLNSGR